MSREFIDKLKKEAIYLAILLAVGIAIFKLLFKKEDFLIVLRVVFAIFWVYILPGFSLMYYWHEKVNFTERLIISFAISAAIVGISSYYLGLLGLDLSYHALLLPAVVILCGFWIILVKTKQDKAEMNK